MFEIVPLEYSHITRMTLLDMDKFTVSYDFNFYLDYLNKWPFFQKTCFYDGSITGYFMAMLKTDENNEVFAHISVLTVAQNFRKQSIAQLLVEDFINTCKYLGLKKIELNVAKKNEYAQIFYKQVGFETRYLMEKYYANDDGISIY